MWFDILILLILCYGVNIYIELIDKSGPIYIQSLKHCFSDCISILMGKNICWVMGERKKIYRKGCYSIKFVARAICLTEYHWTDYICFA